MSNDKMIIPGQLYQYKSLHFAKCVDTNWVIQRSSSDPSPTNTATDYTRIGYIRNDYIPCYSKEPTSISHPTSVFSAISILTHYSSLNWAERKMAEYPKVVLLVLRNKTIKSTAKFNPNLILAKKTYCEVQAINPETDSVFPDKLWVLESWIEPLCAESYYEKFLADFKNKIKKMREAK